MMTPHRDLFSKNVIPMEGEVSVGDGRTLKIEGGYGLKVSQSKSGSRSGGFTFTFPFGDK